jgi:thiol-disulfide isomerase/thioredoxin
MSSRKQSKSKPRKTVRRRKTSIAGKILPPVDIRSDKTLNEFKKRILKGPVTIVLIYADWCGHCHQIMPHFDKASKSPNRSSQVVKINETMLNDVNTYVNKSINKSAEPINADGYPSIILVDNKGNRITDIEPVKDATTLTKVMDNAGNLSRKSGLVNNSELNMKNSLRNNKPVNVVNNIVENEIVNIRKNFNVGEESIVDNVMNESFKNIKNNTNIVKNEVVNEIEPKVNSVSKQEANFVTSISTQSPPNANADLESISNSLPPNKKIGGSLYGAISRTAYTLAPIGVLLATAAAVKKNKKTKSTKKHLKKKHLKKKHTKKNKN